MAKNERALVTTLTKKMAEDLTDYLLERGIKVEYLHSDVDTLRRVELLRMLREGKIDVIVGINLLREGLDLPEVSLVAILDADKEGFLRSYRSLIQTIGRAARNVSGTVSCTPTRSPKPCASHRRDQPPPRHPDRLQPGAWHRSEAADQEDLRCQRHARQGGCGHPDLAWWLPQRGQGRQHASGRAGTINEADKRHEEILKAGLPAQDLADLIRQLSEQMHTAAEQLQFELAARLRDEIRDLKKELRQMTEASK